MSGGALIQLMANETFENDSNSIRLAELAVGCFFVLVCAWLFLLKK